MVKLKSSSVNLSNIHKKVFFAIYKVAEIYEEMGIDLVITSARDSIHSKHSLHYVGRAIDIRVFNIPQQYSHKDVMEKIKKAIGDDEFDVVYEKTHIHIEYDPH